LNTVSLEGTKRAWTPRRGEFAGKIALVTGAAQGIGAAISRSLASRGAVIVVTDVNEDGAREVARQLCSLGGAAISRGLEVRLSGEVDRVVGEVEDEVGPLAVVVNNAGLCKVEESLDVVDETWRLQIDVMLSGPFYVSRAAGRYMVKRQFGSIVNVCSIGGLGGHPGRAAYNAAKGGLKVLTEVLAVEWAPHGVRVNGIAPGVTRTGSTAEIVLSGKGQIQTHDFEARTPLQRLAEAHEIAESVSFLASSGAGYVTGQTLVIDGGWMASDGFGD
jgi:NAD(P)-dependent dehydrogenase (short-subunit alcohol dehydrogenase family)